MDTPHCERSRAIVSKKCALTVREDADAWITRSSACGAVMHCCIVWMRPRCKLVESTIGHNHYYRLLSVAVGHGRRNKLNNQYTIFVIYKYALSVIMKPYIDV